MTDDQSTLSAPPSFYAVVSEGTVHILHITNMTCDMVQYSGLDTTSEILGVY